jgi:hypothetical protein
MTCGEIDKHVLILFSIYRHFSMAVNFVLKHLEFGSTDELLELETIKKE